MEEHRLLESLDKLNERLKGKIQLSRADLVSDTGWKNVFSEAHFKVVIVEAFLMFSNIFKMWYTCTRKSF